MHILKLISLFFICISLATGSIASAAMTCCIQKDMANKEKVPNSNADMSCHKAEYGKLGSNYKTCDGCKTCININAVIPSDFSYAPAYINISHTIPTDSFFSQETPNFYTPPILLS